MTTRGLQRIVAAIAFLAVIGAAAPAAENGNANGSSAQDARGAVVVFGDSLTAGYGLEPEEAYPSLLRERIERAGLPFTVVNAGLSGETTAAGARRAAWVLRQPVAVFILALGGNDGLRGVPPDETERNLQAIIDVVRERQPQARIIVAGMESPPNMGPDFTSAFRSIFPRLARANDAPLISFLLEGVGGVPEMNLDDGIHPNPAGQKIVADNVWRVLEPVLRQLSS